MSGLKKSNYKKLIILFMAFVTVFSLFTVFNTAVNAAEVWDGRSSQNYSGGSGTSSDPYQIANGAQLYYLALHSDSSYYVLTDNINMGNVMFPMISSFSGELDGQGHVIYNLKLSATSDYVGLIKTLTGTVKNLAIAGNITTTSTSYCGAFAGYMTKGSIVNCTNFCTISSSGTAGGIAGYVENTAYISKCVNNGGITASNAGGIAGEVISATYENANVITSISKCYNLADITASSYAGGIAAQQQGTTISQSVNTGKVCSTKSVAGGIVGYGFSDNCKSWGYSSLSGSYSSRFYHSSHISNCYNTGDISGATAAGGVAGQYCKCIHTSAAGKAGHQAYGATSSVTNVYNVGKVTGGSTGDIYGYSYASDSFRANVNLTNGYYVQTNNPSASVIYGTGYSEDDMKAVGAYAGFSFDTVWNWDGTGEYDYPILSEIGLPSVKCNHDYDYVDAYTSCTDTGVRTYTCKYCGSEYEEALDAPGHKYGAWVTVLEPTEFKEGCEERTCSECNYKEQNTLDKLPHTHISDNGTVTVEATCTEEGSVVFRCKSCYEYLFEEPIDPTGHSFTSYVSDNNATCTKDGSKTAKCDRCDVKDTVADVGSATGHSFTNYINDNNATCTRNGTETAYCDNNCGKKNTVGISGSRLGHEYRVEVQQPTCIEVGRFIYVCIRCEDSYLSEETIPVTQHILGTAVSVVAPTCTGEGYTLYECTYCHAITKADYTAKTSHTIIDKEYREATCIHSGYTVKGCADCDYEVTYVIEPIGHNYTAEITGSTCTEGGYTTNTCLNCGEYYLDHYTEPTGHDMGLWSVSVEATYITEGEEKRLCNNCEYEEKRAVPVKEYVNRFTDVKSSAWYYDSIEFVVKHGYMNGMSETVFSPNSNITREQFVLILANIAGVETNEFKTVSSGFADVPTGQWYSGAVTWAVHEGYVSGMSATKFGRGQSIQRAALARMLYNYASKNGINVDGRAELSAFGDAKEFDKAGNAWMKEPVQWAVDAGIISGMTVNGKNCVNPKGTATRAQAARMLMQFDELIK